MLIYCWLIRMSKEEREREMEEEREGKKERGDSKEREERLLYVMRNSEKQKVRRHIHNRPFAV